MTAKHHSSSDSMRNTTVPAHGTLTFSSIVCIMVVLANFVMADCLQLHPRTSISSRSRSLIHPTHVHCTRCLTACRMNKIPNYFDMKNNADDTINVPETETKRGIFRRVKDRISKTFGDKGDKVNNDEKEPTEIKPSLFDAARLKLALAMSSINFNMFQRNEEWVVACPKTRVGPGVITPCVVNGLDIIIFASRDGKRLDAFANSCPHLGSPFDLATIEQKPVLEGGREVEGGGCVDCIVCPVHRTAFEIQSGDVRGEWCPYPPVLGGIMGYVKPKNSLVKFAVRLKGKNVEVRIATSMKNVDKGDEEANGMTDIQ